MEPVGSEPQTSRMERVASDDGPGLAQQNAQQVELLGRQAQLHVADEGAMGCDVHADVLARSSPSAGSAT